MKISVITVCYNSGSTIADCLHSVAQQSWANFEHIVIDGASTDDTLKLIGEKKHDKMIVVSEPDEGIYDAMNKGLSIASGDYVAFLNSDDLYAHADVLQLVAEKAADTKADCILGDVQFFSSDIASAHDRYYSASRYSLWRLKLGIMPPHPGLFVKRKLLTLAGGFNQNYRISADFDLIARLLLKHDANWTSLGKATTFFRNGGLTTSGGNVRKQLSREMTLSLRELGVLFPKYRVLLRYPVKVLQYLAVGRSRDGRRLSAKTSV